MALNYNDFDNKPFFLCERYYQEIEKLKENEIAFFTFVMSLL